MNHAPQLDLVWKNLESLKAAGLDLERVRSDMDAPDIARLIEQDLADGSILGVTKTPEFFVNGRPLPSFGHPQPLEMLCAPSVDRGNPLERSVRRRELLDQRVHVGRGQPGVVHG